MWMEHIKEGRRLSYLLNEAYENDLFASKAKDCEIEINGKWLIDTSMACGSRILGHSFLGNSIYEFIDNGSVYGLPNIHTIEAGELLHKTTGFEKFVFCNSGSEALMRAIRIARFYTGRDKICVFEGCWHGSQDWNSCIYFKGIPNSVRELVSVMPFTDEAFDIIKKEKPALVIAEPIQGSLPIERKEFLANIRRLTKDVGSLLCFDDVILGFRISLGGSSEHFNILPDLVTYGKIVGGGFPVGVVAGNEVMEVIKSGVQMGGTFSANPVTIGACIKTIKELEKNNIYSYINKLNSILLSVKSDILQVIGSGVLRLVFTNKHLKTLEDRDKFELPKDIQNILLKELRDMGVYVGSNKLLLLSSKHTEEIVYKIKECLESVR